MDVNLNINGIPVLGTIKIENTIYYVDKNRSIYIYEDDTYKKVNDMETLKKVLRYISPRSMDVIYYKIKR